jgi:uncharacterized repeat protein (TIGR03803 family)
MFLKSERQFWLGWGAMFGKKSMRFSILTLAMFSALLIFARPGQAQTETILYNFCTLQGTCPDGAAPYSPLTPDGSRNFFGTTDSGSGVSGSYGDIFELSPNGSGGWNETVIHTFAGGVDGEYPLFSPLIFDSAGNFYGTTSGGGTHGQGLVFEFSPAGDSWTEKEIYSVLFRAVPTVPIPQAA